MKKSSEIFLEYLTDFYKNLKEQPIGEVVGDVDKTAIISVDVTNAFCRTGNLASSRVAAIIDPIVNLFHLGWSKGIHKVVLLHDCHTAHAEEFDAFGEHAICGTVESEAVEEIKSLLFYKNFTVIEKNSINPAQNTEFSQWLADHAEISTFIVVGDCTDLCIYQTTMHLRTDANSRDIARKVIIPEDCVETYDISVEEAENSPAEPHPGDLLHLLFLHHMHLNGIKIYKKLV